MHIFTLLFLISVFGISLFGAATQAVAQEEMDQGALFILALVASIAVLIIVLRYFYAKKSSQEIDRLKNYDLHTGLPNRFYFQEQLQRDLVEAQQHNTKVALFFLDLDRFKNINEKYGHDLGDTLLQMIAQRLQQAVQKEDATLASLGGDEFVLILNHLTDDAQADAVAQKMLESLNEPFVIKEHVIQPTCSIGISIYPDDTFYTQELMKFADKATQESKQNGGARYTRYLISEN